MPSPDLASTVPLIGLVMVSDWPAPTVKYPCCKNEMLPPEIELLPDATLRMALATIVRVLPLPMLSDTSEPPIFSALTLVSLFNERLELRVTFWKALRVLNY